MRKSWNAPSGLPALACGLPVDEVVMVDRAEIARQRFQLEIEVVQRDGAVVDDDLIDLPLLPDPAIVAADDGDEAVALALHFLSSRNVTVKVTSSFCSAAHVGHEVHGHDLRRERSVGGHDLDLARRSRR